MRKHISMMPSRRITRIGITSANSTAAAPRSSRPLSRYVVVLPTGTLPAVTDDDPQVGVPTRATHEVRDASVPPQTICRIFASRR